MRDLNFERKTIAPDGIHDDVETNYEKQSNVTALCLISVSVILFVIGMFALYMEVLK